MELNKNHIFIIMNFKNTPFSIQNKNRREINYVKAVYRERIQSEIDTYYVQDEKPDTIKAQDVLYLDKVFI